MSNQLKEREKKWVPPSRPEWMIRINEEGRHLDLKSVVPLDENSLIETAKANTGLDDFGDDDWYEPFKILTKSFDTYSDLHLMGRIMTRANTLNVLQSRLQIQDTFKRHPEIADDEINQLFYIIGQGRSGTSMLHNILSAIPENGTTLEWEPMFPCPPPEKDTYLTDLRIELTDHLITMHVRAAPEIASMHEFGARISSEIGQVQALTMKSSRT